MAIALKLLATPVLIAIATLAARRYGQGLGGLLAGLPLVSGPLSVFLALEQGTDFAARAALSGLLGLAAVAGFCAVYALAARIAEWPWAALSGLGAYILCALILARPDMGPFLSLLLVLAAIVAALILAGRPGPESARPFPPWWDIPFRMAGAVAIVLAITGFAPHLGARWSGLLSQFPVFASVMAVFSHWQGGPAAARRLLAGIVTGSSSSACFLLFVGLTIRHHTLPWTYGVGAAIAFAVGWLCLPVLRAT